MDGDCGYLAEFTASNYLTILFTSNYKNSQLSGWRSWRRNRIWKNATQIMIFLPNYMWAENNNYFHDGKTCLVMTPDALPQLDTNNAVQNDQHCDGQVNENDRGHQR